MGSKGTVKDWEIIADNLGKAVGVWAGSQRVAGKERKNPFIVAATAMAIWNTGQSQPQWPVIVPQETRRSRMRKLSKSASVQRLIILLTWLHWPVPKMPLPTRRTLLERMKELA